jgi:hypothetical protein
MPGPHPKALRHELALAVAGGGSIRAWAKAHGISTTACYEWSREPEFKAKVERIRDRMTDRAVGTLTKNLVSAMEEMSRLARKGKQESTRLAACRAVAADLAGLKSQDLARRVEAMEQQLRERSSPRKKDRKA